MQPGFWRNCRICVRWLRRAVLAALLAAICILTWFDRVGLPGFLTNRVVAALQEHGIVLVFSRMHLSVSRGLVAEDVHVDQGKGRENPSVSARQVALEIDYHAALHRHLQLDGLVIRDGRFILPLSETNALALTNIQTDLRWETNGLWVLNNFKAGFQGIQLGLSGQVANGSKISQWEIFHGKNTGNAEEVRERLRNFYDAFQKIHFANPTLLSLNVQGDALDLHSFNLQLFVNAPSVASPWGEAKLLRMGAWLTAATNATTNYDPALGFWTNVLPYRLTWNMRVGELNHQELAARSVSAAGYWNTPVLAITNLSAGLGGGGIDVKARLDILTREFTFTNRSDFDLHVVDPFLAEKPRQRLADVSWAQPPQVRAAGSMIFPAWTNLDVDWRTVAQPTLCLNGNVAFNDGAIQGVPVESAAAQFSYSNLVWRVPLFDFAQYNTRLEASGSEDDATRNYQWNVHGTFDAESLPSFLPPTNAARVLRHFSSAEPFYLSAEGSGNLRDPNSLYATGHLACTNFAVREQHVQRVVGDFVFTNRLLKFQHAQIWPDTGTMTADEVVLDFDKNLIRFKNGHSTAMPQVVVAAIGPKTAEIMAPYQFLQPPTALINGCVPMGDVEGREDTDLRFDVVGGAPFETHKFRATSVTGTIHWLGQNLILTNIVANLYNGTGTGYANFDFKVPHEGADYYFQARYTNVDLHLLMYDQSSPTNNLQGAFSGNLVVTHASTEDWQTVNGYGNAQLQNGLIWDTPIFGFISKALNQVLPGLGNSRATDAGGSYTITNGVIYSDTLQINAGASRLQYVGTVDLKQNVNARVTAQLMHNVWGVGPFLSTVFFPVTKIFEYRVTGNLQDPKHEPIYVLSRLMLMPLHPIQTIQNIFKGGNNSPTNAAPK
jgi:hypothetical protein